MTSAITEIRPAKGSGAAFLALVAGAMAMGVSRSVLAGLALCKAGGGALLAHSFNLHAGRAIGDLFGLMTGVFFGLYFLAAQAARRNSSAARVTFEATLITSALLFLVALVMEHRFWPNSLGGVAALFAMAWISHAGGQGLLTAALGPPAGRFFLAGDLSGSDRGGLFRLGRAWRTGQRDPGGGRARHSFGHLCGAAVRRRDCVVAAC